MKPKYSFEPHLVLREVAVAHGCELTLVSPGWHMLYVSSGIGYWLQSRMNFDLMAGSVLIFPDGAQGMIRASQLAQVRLHYFRLQPERLMGLFTWGEQQYLEKAIAVEQFAARSFGPATPISEKFKHLCEHNPGSSLAGRLQMLDLFVEAFGQDLQKPKPNPGPAIDAKARLTRFLSDTLPAELLDMSFADLVRETRCTPRHLSRIFQQVMGMTFREKQAHLRLARAQELLATTESKVVDVALESGYQSPCLFNLMFKRRFGVTPSKWREQRRNLKDAGRREIRVSIVKA